MERNTPVRKPHTSTADLLTWSETPQPDPAAASRPHQPSDGIRKVVFGGQVTDEESESLNKRKPPSGYKLKEMTGSRIFAANGENEESEPGNADPASNNKTGIRMYQQTLAGISHFSFAEEDIVSPKKPTTLPEVAKQRELSGSLESEDSKLKKQLSDAKCKELSGHDIFASPPEILPRPTVRALALKDNSDMGELHTRNLAGGGMSSEDAAVKTAKKIIDQNFVELSGNDIFKGDVTPGSAEKLLSMAKLQEISGSNIFADGKAESRDYLGGVRKPQAVLIKAGSLWVAWMYNYVLIDDNIWYAVALARHMWAWKKLVKLRNDIRGVPGPIDPYSAGCAWDLMRRRAHKVDWFQLVWKGKIIPRHYFISWLVVLNRLPTKDRMVSWGRTTSVSCLLCNGSMESQNHLFAECSYAAEIWNWVYTNCSSLVIRSNNWNCLLHQTSACTKSSSARSLIVKIAWNAVIYYVWRERNCRIHDTGHVSTTDTIKKLVMDYARNMIGGFRSTIIIPTSLSVSWGI